MGRGILKAQMRDFENIGRHTAEAVPEKRREGYDLKYEYADAVKSGYGVFFFQHPSMLNFQQELERKYRRSNVENILEVTAIPSNNQITRLLDVMEPSAFAETFDNDLKLVDHYGALEPYRVLDGGVLITLDGTWFFASENIHCEHCLHITKKEVTTYYHSMVSAAIVKPGESVVLPLMPEFVRNEDGAEKQDCERNAAKRWLESQKGALEWLKPTFLGDDLYACHEFCKQILGMGMSFIFTCKDDSHPWIREQVEQSLPEEYTKREWNGRNHLEYRYRWVNGIENRAEGEILLVNYLYFEIWNEEKGKVTYKNSWMTDKKIDAGNVTRLAGCARARWKIENEYNNTLKNHGYNLEHNFGHGENHASEIYCVLNLLAFMMHGMLQLLDEDYQKARATFGRRNEFFSALRFAFRRFLHNSWEDFMIFVLGDEPDG